jgi:hypothetical protein
MVHLLALAEGGEQPEAGGGAYHAKQHDGQRRKLGEGGLANGRHQSPQHIGEKGHQMTRNVLFFHTFYRFFDFRGAKEQSFFDLAKSFRKFAAPKMVLGSQQN